MHMASKGAEMARCNVVHAVLHIQVELADALDVKHAPFGAVMTVLSLVLSLTDTAA